jgi:transcription elongation factor GreA
MHVNYLSAEGLKKLQEELVELKTVKRREAAERIEVAKSLGDLSENAEYHEAHEAATMIEGRIFEIEEMLKNVQLFDEAKSTGSTKVRVGTTVTVEINGKERVFTIVGSNEADPLAGKISNESPIGQALLGSTVGQSVSVRTPVGENVYKIVRIA